MYNKNFEELPFGRNIANKKSSHAGDLSISSDGRRYKTFTFDYLFRKLVEYNEDQCESRSR